MRGGMIVRLIDVVLILLFGFIAISDIQLKRQIRLPGPAKDEPKEQPGTLFLVVAIEKDGPYVLKIDEKEILRTRKLRDLRLQLRRTAQAVRSEHKSPVVIIDPDPDATMQRTIDVFDLCEKERLPKSINMQLSRESSAE